MKSPDDVTAIPVGAAGDSVIKKSIEPFWSIGTGGFVVSRGQGDITLNSEQNALLLGVAIAADHLAPGLARQRRKRGIRRPAANHPWRQQFLHRAPRPHPNM
jgi:hypothetical protein